LSTKVGSLKRRRRRAGWCAGEFVEIRDRIGPLVSFTGLSGPDGVAVDAAGNVYVADYGNNRVVKLAIVGA
jgi:DNA-binding beta-propeller fold protein YncE